MNGPEDLRRELRAARQRTAELSAAVLRTNASLDLAAVLQEAVDAACALTAARYGIVTTIDETGVVRDFVSSGFTDEEHRQFLDGRTDRSSSRTCATSRGPSVSPTCPRLSARSASPRT